LTQSVNILLPTHLPCSILYYWDKPNWEINTKIQSYQKTILWSILFAFLPQRIFSSINTEIFLVFISVSNRETSNKNQYKKNIFKMRLLVIVSIIFNSPKIIVWSVFSVTQSWLNMTQFLQIKIHCLKNENESDYWYKKIFSCWMIL
jgi:hypothetical protein